MTQSSSGTTRRTAGRFTPQAGRISRRSFETVLSPETFRSEPFGSIPFGRRNRSVTHLGTRCLGTTSRSSRRRTTGHRASERLTRLAATDAISSRNPSGCDSVHAAIIDVGRSESRKFGRLPSPHGPPRGRPGGIRRRRRVGREISSHPVRPTRLRRPGSSRGEIATLFRDKGRLVPKLDTMSRVNEPPGGLKKAGPPQPGA